MVSFQNWDPLPSILSSTKGCEVMSSFGSPVSEHPRHCPEETTRPWHCSVDHLYAVYLVPATQLSQLLPFPSQLLWLWELTWVWNLLLYHPPRSRCQLLLLIPHRPLISLQLGERVARWKEMSVVVTFLIMANFLSSYHAPGPMLSTLHIWSYLILTKTL